VPRWSRGGAWLPVRLHDDTAAASAPALELSYRVAGGHLPPRVWRCRADVDAARPVDALAALVRQRHAWDDSVARWRVVDRLDACTDLFRYVVAPPTSPVTSSVTSSSPAAAAAAGDVVLPRPAVDMCELR